MSYALWLKQRIDSPRFGKIEHYGQNDLGYYLRATSLNDLDDDVQRWL